MDRNETLLNKAAEAFNDQMSPFTTDWLVEHEVTADECFDLSQNIATVLYGYIAAPNDVKQRILLIGATVAAGMPAEVTAGADASLRSRQILKEIESI